ncbi:hypothetical protein C8Q75DRAFT_770284 [Abortiporus biennis]|nr:hypothetical protein C8Q75DRAFT_770284 [Abortiporus biennis]
MLNTDLVTSDGPLSLDKTLGSMFIGYSISMILYGVTCLQVALYFYKHRQQPWGMKVVVLSLWILDNFHVALTTAGMYRNLVSFRGDPLKVIKPLWSLSAQVYVTLVVHFLIRMVYSYRIWRLSHGNIIIPFTVAVLSLIVVGVGATFASLTLGIDNWTESRSFAWAMYSGFGVEVAADLVIAIAMTVLLVRMRTGLKSSDSLVQTLIMYTINTGVLTTIVVILTLITYICLQQSFAFIGCYFILSKIYINSLLGTLNAPSIPTHKSSHREEGEGSTESRPFSGPALLTTAIMIEGIASTYTQFEHARRPSGKDVVPDLPYMPPVQGRPSNNYAKGSLARDDNDES